MKNAIRAVICLSVVSVSAVSTYNLLSIHSYAAGIQNGLIGEYNEEPIVATTKVVRTVYEIPELSSTNREVECMVLVDSRVIVDSVNLLINSRYVTTEPVKVDVDSLMQSYYQDYSDYEWDEKNKIDIIYTLWNFLVEQNDVDEVIASAIIGSVMYEGRFAEEQKSYYVLKDIEDARSKLGDGKRGYGIAQWTYETRQSNLLKYYELANEMFSDNWETACVVAECCMLLREVEAYEVFDDIYSHTTIEDAVGRVCLLYETYDGCYEQWSSDGGYHLISTEGSGLKRLEYSKSIYDHFVNE